MPVIHRLLTASLCLLAITAPPALAQGGKASGMVSGLVLDSLGEPVAAAEVCLEKWNEPDKPLRKTRTDGEGMFVMNQVPLGDAVRLRATAPDHIVGSAYVRLSKARPRSTATIRLWAAGTIRGRVLDGDGKAVPGATVIASFDDARVFGFDAQAETTTDAQGNYVLAKVPLGYINVRVLAGGHAMSQDRVYLRDKAELNPRLSRAKGIDLTVRVEGLKEQEATGVRVRVLPYQGGSGQALPRQMVQGQIDASGTWVSRGLPDMEFVVSVTDDKLTFVPRQIRLQPKDPARRRRGFGVLRRAPVAKLGARAAGKARARPPAKPPAKPPARPMPHRTKPCSVRFGMAPSSFAASSGDPTRGRCPARPSSAGLRTGAVVRPP